MRIKELFEKHYRGPLYHATDIISSIGIIESGSFNLSTNYLKNKPKYSHSNISNYDYCMSSSRDKYGSYRAERSKSKERFVIKENAIFVLNPNNFGKDVMTVPFNDFGNFRKSKGFNEAEEIILSNSNRIPINGLVYEFHIRSVDVSVELFIEGNTASMLKRNLPKYNIKCYIYERDSFNDFMLLNKRKGFKLV